MNDFAISDLLIGDTSSINFEYLITCKPIIIVDTITSTLNMPTDLNILDIVQTYQSNKNDICSMIDFELNKILLIIIIKCCITVSILMMKKFSKSNRFINH